MEVDGINRSGYRQAYNPAPPRRTTENRMATSHTPRRVEIEAVNDGSDGVQIQLVLSMVPGVSIHSARTRTIVTFYSDTPFAARTLAQDLAGVIDTLTEYAEAQEKAVKA